MKAANVPAPPSLNQLDDEQMIALLRSGEHAQALSAYFGEPLYRELQALVTTPPAPRNGVRVYVLPGLMGSKLGWNGAHGVQLPWLDPNALVQGELSRLSLPSRRPLQALGAMLPTYLKLKLSLVAAGFDVRLYAYDWRLGVLRSGEALARELSADPASQIMLVAHSMGGLVARAALRSPGGEKVVRLIQLGAPNQGSFALVQALRAVYPTVRKLAALDRKHSAETLAKKVFHTLPGLYDLLPRNGDADFFDLHTWPASGPRPDARLLRQARLTPGRLADVDERCHTIVGFGQPTLVGVKRSRSGFVYQFSNEGDGTVPVALARWQGADCHYVATKHGELVRNDLVGRAIVDLLKTGQTQSLLKNPPRSRGKKVLRTESSLRRSLACKLRWEQLPLEERRTLLEPYISPRFRALCRKRKSKRK